jgi:hypothetical protein
MLMTACSNHPATVKGAELQKLVAASDKLQARLNERITQVASRCGIDLEAYLLLHQLSNGAGQSEERGLGLLRSAGLATGEAPNIIVTTEGIKAYAAINQARFDWLDSAAEHLDVEQLRIAAALLSKIKV